ncbi:hypothetical protein BGW38_002604, partial [Lunasporangiospora selenospora]
MKLSLAAAIGLIALSTIEAVKVNPIPAPVTLQWGKSGPVKFDNNFRIVGPKNAILSKAISRTTKLIKKERWTPATWEEPIPVFKPFPTLSKRADEDEVEDEVEDKVVANTNGGGRVVRTINVEVANLNAELQAGVDETYTLDISSNGKGTIKAKTVWGALHGLTTLEQIVISDGRRGLHIEQPVKIADGPKFAHRGVMLDTARNFYPVKDILRQIDGLAWSKLNVFHWHITDNQS